MHLETNIFLCKLEKTYEEIVHNYRDYEKNNFSIILNNALKTNDASPIKNISNSIDRYISNILTSTYTYTCLLKHCEKSEKTDHIKSLKDEFKKITHDLYDNNYQYTFVCKLRNKINHGGSLSKIINLGSSWSSYWVQSNHNDDLIIARKDERFPLLDIEVSKEEAKRIIDNSEHFNNIKDSVPDIFYLRNSIREYINLLSLAHSEIRGKSAEQVILSDSIISSYLKGAGSATLIKYDNDVEIENMSILNYQGNINKSKAPLYLEKYPMPGEFKERPTEFKD